MRESIFFTLSSRRRRTSHNTQRERLWKWSLSLFTREKNAFLVGKWESVLETSSRTRGIKYISTTTTIRWQSFLETLTFSFSSWRERCSLVLELEHFSAFEFSPSCSSFCLKEEKRRKMPNLHYIAPLFFLPLKFYLSNTQNVPVH